MRKERTEAPTRVPIVGVETEKVAPLGAGAGASDAITAVADAATKSKAHAAFFISIATIEFVCRNLPGVKT